MLQKKFLFLQEHYYDPLSHCRYLETKLHNLQQNLEQGQRHYRKHKITIDSGGTERPDMGMSKPAEEISWSPWSKGCGPELRSFQISSQAWRKHNRCRAWIAKNSPAETLNEYPLFLDIPNLIGSLFFVWLLGHSGERWIHIRYIVIITLCEQYVSKSLITSASSRHRATLSYIWSHVCVHLMNVWWDNSCVTGTPAPSIRSAITYLDDFFTVCIQ